MEPKYAGGVWPFGKPADFDANPIDGWQFAQRCIDMGAGVLRASGYWNEDHNYLEPGDKLALYERVERGSREDVALALWQYAQAGRAMLSWASEGKVEAAEVAASYYANMGILHHMLLSMEPAGIAEMAVRGAASFHAGKVKGPAGRRIQARDATLDKYGRVALDVAAELRRRNVAISRAEIIREIRASWSTRTSRPLRNLPKSDRQIDRYLAKHGY